MSAEPARPGPDDSAGPATVILFRNKTRPPRLTQRTGSEPPPDTGDTSPQRHLANRIAELFLKHDRRTLIDPETEQVFLITLDLVTDMLEGARLTGVLNDDQHHELHAMIEGMKAAPRLLA